MCTTAMISNIIYSINENCREKGGLYKDYECQIVSFDDAQRGTVAGAVSYWGANMTDTRLWEKSGQMLFTVRSNRWNEKLGKVSADQIALIVGSHVGPSSSGSRGNDLQTVSLETFLKKIGKFGGYAGLPANQNLFQAELDESVSIRFQTTFLPEAEEGKTLEFASEACNYNAISDEDPKNLLLLCNTQGTAIQQDGAGAKKLYHHAIDSEGKIHRYWLEAERTTHKVGGGQIETKEERDHANSRGKAVAKLIGLEAMESRFNVLMTIQVPLRQKDIQGTREQNRPVAARNTSDCEYHCLKSFDVCEWEEPDYKEKSSKFPNIPLKWFPMVGTSNAARVSRGSEVDIWPGLSVKHPVERHPKEHVTVTVVIYHTAAGGVPPVDDVIAAIDDMEALYASCKWTGRLADDGAGFVKKELTVGDLLKIDDKFHLQPYKQHSVSMKVNSPEGDSDEGLVDDGAGLVKENTVNDVVGISKKVSKPQQPSQAQCSDNTSKTKKRSGKCSLL